MPVLPSNSKIAMAALGFMIQRDVAMLKYSSSGTTMSSPLVAALYTPDLSAFAGAYRSFEWRGGCSAGPSETECDRAFLMSVETAAALGDLDTSMDLVIEKFDLALDGSNFEECNRLLAKLDPQRVPVEVSLAVLTVTAPMPPSNERTAFLTRTRDLLVLSRGAADARELLSGLES